MNITVKYTDVLVTNGVICQYLWKFLANHPHEWQNKLIHGNPYIISLLTCFSGAKIQKNLWKLPSIDRRTLVACGGSVGCGIVTSRKHLLWRYLTDCPQNVLSGSRTSSRRRQDDHHSFIIESDSRRFHWLVCKKPISCGLSKRKPIWRVIAPDVTMHPIKYIFSVVLFYQPFAFDFQDFPNLLRRHWGFPVITSRYRKLIWCYQTTVTWTWSSIMLYCYL